jgi:chemotaxis methyl-accepting protein methylase
MTREEQPRNLLYALPGVKRFERSRLGERARHRFALHFEDRQSFTYTQFFRLPTQYAALTGPVLDFVGGPQRREPLRIVVVACSMGAEAYSIASLLMMTHPQLDFTIDAFDIDAGVIALAKQAVYEPDWVLRKGHVTPDLIAATFDEANGKYVVKPAVARRVRFQVGDILDADAVRRVAPADVVYAQNMLCNMRRPIARRAFANLGPLLGPRSALFVDGMDLDIRSRLTRALGLEPLDYRIQSIHDEARQVRGPRYPWFATGLEPFEVRRKDRARRYATVFLRGA